MVMLAEDWVDSLMGRLESSYDIFPSSVNFRLGPLIFDVANMLNITLGSELDTRDFLRLVTLLRFGSTHPELGLMVPRQLPPDGLGYISRVTIEREDGRFVEENGNVSVVLSVVGGWMYDLPDGRLDGSDGAVTFLYPSEEIGIRYKSTSLISLSCFCMPRARSDMPNFLPGVHDGNEPSDVAPGDPTLDSPSAYVRIDLSNLINHLFPLLTVHSEHAKTYTSGALAAQLSTTIAKRLIETPWRPDILFGRRCPHSEDYKRPTRCSLTSWEIIGQVLPPCATLLRSQEDFRAEYPSRMRKEEAHEHFQTLLKDYERRFSYLTARLGPFERHHLSIVRCGAVDGPPDPIVLIAGALGKKIYVLHAQECWHCACAQMLRAQCTVGIAVDIRIRIKCEACVTAETRAKEIAQDIEQNHLSGSDDGQTL
jgi:hypothetical protein